MHVQEERLMYRHDSNCMEGPISNTSLWWTWTTPADRPIRFELVERVRREIAAGSYETPEKWEMALERLVWRLEQG